MDTVKLTKTYIRIAVQPHHQRELEPFLRIIKDNPDDPVNLQVLHDWAGENGYDGLVVWVDHRLNEPKVHSHLTIPTDNSGEEFTLRARNKHQKILDAYEQAITEGHHPSVLHPISPKLQFRSPHINTKVPAWMSYRDELEFHIRAMVRTKLLKLERTDPEHYEQLLREFSIKPGQYAINEIVSRLAFRAKQAIMRRYMTEGQEPNYQPIPWSEIYEQVLGQIEKLGLPF